MGATLQDTAHGIIGLVVEYSLAMAVTWVRFPDDASASMVSCGQAIHHVAQRSIMWPSDPSCGQSIQSYQSCGQAIHHVAKLSSMRSSYHPCGHAIHPGGDVTHHVAMLGHVIHHVAMLSIMRHVAMLFTTCQIFPRPSYPSCVRCSHHVSDRSIMRVELR